MKEKQRSKLKSLDNKSLEKLIFANEIYCFLFKNNSFVFASFIHSSSFYFYFERPLTNNEKRFLFVMSSDVEERDESNYVLRN